MTTTPDAPSRVSAPLPRFRSRIARRPLTSFFVLAFGLAYPLITLPVLASHGVIPGASLFTALHVDPDEVAGLLLTVPLFASAMTVTWAVDGPAGVRALARRLSRWRVGWGWWLAALAGLPTVGVGVALLLGDQLRPVEPVVFLAGQLLPLAINLFLVNLWEETAWSGVVQTRLERRHSLPVAALLTAVPFALMHWPLSLFGDPTVTSMALALVGYLVLGVLFRPMLAVFLRGGRDSVLLVAVLHSVFNRTQNPDGVLAGLTAHGGADGWAILAATVVVAAVAALVLRRRLGRAHRVELDAMASAEPSRS
jgi:membrane protease YdiL (CAAX protease family)